MSCIGSYSTWTICLQNYTLKPYNIISYPLGDTCPQHVLELCADAEEACAVDGSEKPCNIGLRCSNNKCEIWPAGSYCTQGAVETCVNNTYSLEGASECVACPDGKISPTGSTSPNDCTCAEGQEEINGVCQTTVATEAPTPAPTQAATTTTAPTQAPTTDHTLPTTP